MIFVACSKNETPQTKSNDLPNSSYITKDMGCENCGMDLQMFIQTSHSIHTTDGENHYYCSINCSTDALMNNSFGEVTVFAIDKTSLAYFPVNNAYYVIGSKQPAIMTSVSKYTFKDFEEAKQFKITQNGDSIISYKETYRMCQNELLKR